MCAQSIETKSWIFREPVFELCGLGHFKPESVHAGVELGVHATRFSPAYFALDLKPQDDPFANNDRQRSRTAVSAASASIGPKTKMESPSPARRNSSPSSTSATPRCLARPIEALLRH